MKQTPDDNELTPLAEAVSDGEPVDWDAQAAGHPRLAELVRELRVLEALAALQRPSRDAEPDAAVPAGPALPAMQAVGKWGPLVLLEKVGHGGFGDVYRAFDPALHREVALKLVRPDRLGDVVAVRGFLDEARRLARVRHDNVVVVHGVDRHDGVIGIWSDLIVGRTLEEVLDQSGPFGANEASQVGIELCRALAAVHAAGLVHRDVKTTNVMREHGGRLVLMDFGAASEATGPGAWTASGTPLSTAPEVLRGAHAQPSADLYALGVLLYRLTSARHPYPASTLDDLIAMQASNSRVTLRTLRPDLPAGFVHVVETALQRDPRRRYGDAAAMERALSELVAGGRGGGRISWVLGAVAVLAALGVWLALRQPHAGSVPSPRGLADSTMDRSAGAPLRGSNNPGATGPAAATPMLGPAATLHRERNGKVTQLAPGGSVSPGDALSLEFACPDSMYIYVLSADEQGKTFVLFPAPGLDLANPLSGHTTHRLPGTRKGKPFDWQVTSAGGSETVMVVASRTPMDELARKLRDVEPVRAGRPVADGEADSSAGPLRGIGGMRASARPSQDVGGRRLEKLLSGALPSGVDPPWVWSIRLAETAR